MLIRISLSNFQMLFLKLFKIVSSAVVVNLNKKTVAVFVAATDFLSMKLPNLIIVKCLSLKQVT